MKTSQKIKIYLASFFLAPLGLYWFFKYRKNPDKEIRKVGSIALWITIVTLVISTITFSLYINAISGYISMYKDSLGIIY